MSAFIGWWLLSIAIAFAAGFVKGSMDQFDDEFEAGVRFAERIHRDEEAKKEEAKRLR